MTQDPLIEDAPLLPPCTRVLVNLSEIEEATITGAPNSSTASMESLGQLDPVKLHVREGRLIGIAEGNRRIQNARKLGWTQIDAFLYPALTPVQVAHIQIASHTRAPNLIAEAVALGRLIRGGASTVDEELAREARLPVPRVRKLRKLLSLPDDVLALTGSVLSEGTAEAVASLQGELRTRAVALIRTRASEEKGRFTSQDLKEIQLARDANLAALVGSASVTLPVVTLSAVDLLAAQVRIMCSEAQVRPEDLIAALSQASAPVPLQAAGGAVAVPDPWDTPVAPVPAAVPDPWDSPLPGPVLPAPVPVPPVPVPPVPIAPMPAAAPTPPTPPVPPRAPSFGVRSFGGIRSAR